MATRERPADRGRRRATEALRRAGEEHRRARVGAGLSLRTAAAASGAARSQLWRFEHGLLRRLEIDSLGAWCAVVGLDLALRTYPAADPLRDRAHLALLERLRGRLHPSLAWRTEVALALPGDLRSWDGQVSGDRPDPWRMRVEAETNITDGQALERRLSLKLRDDPEGHLLLLVSDTRANRAALKVLAPGLQAIFPLSQRHILGSFRDGLDPGGNGIVVL